MQSGKNWVGSNNNDNDKDKALGASEATCAFERCRLRKTNTGLRRPEWQRKTPLRTHFGNADIRDCG